MKTLAPTLLRGALALAPEPDARARPEAPAPAAPPVAELDDAALVARCRAGDRAAQEVLLGRYQRPLYALLRGYLRDPEDARDVAQRALLEAFAHLGQLRGDLSFRAWLYRIGLNLAARESRARRRLVLMPEPAETAAPEPGGEQRLLGAARSEALRRAVAELPEKQRQTVELRAFADLSFREVAAALHCSEDAAKMNFHHGLRRLRALLAGGEHEPA